MSRLFQSDDDLAREQTRLVSSLARGKDVTIDANAGARIALDDARERRYQGRIREAAIFVFVLPFVVELVSWLVRVFVDWRLASAGP